MFDINRIIIRGEIHQRLFGNQAENILCVHLFRRNHIFQSKTKNSLVISFKHTSFKIVRLEWYTVRCESKEKVKNKILVHLICTSYYSYKPVACLQIPRNARNLIITHAQINIRFSLISLSRVRKNAGAIFSPQFCVDLDVELFIHAFIHPCLVRVWLLCGGEKQVC